MSCYDNHENIKPICFAVPNQYNFLMPNIMNVLVLFLNIPVQVLRMFHRDCGLLSNTSSEYALNLIIKMSAGSEAERSFLMKFHSATV